MTSKIGKEKILSRIKIVSKLLKTVKIDGNWM